MNISESTDAELCEIIMAIGRELQKRPFSVGGGIHSLCEGFIHSDDGTLSLQRTIESVGACELSRVRYVSSVIQTQEQRAKERETKCETK